MGYEWGHRPALTGLRALAVMLVIAFHAQVADMPAGFVGVDLFFVLSGFLVCQVLLGDGDGSDRPRLRNFYARRTRRLLPAALLAAVGGTVMTAGVIDQSLRETTVDSARASLLYFQNWHRIVTAEDFALGELFGTFNHWWSLSIEEQYYALFPLVVAAVALVARRAATWWLAAVLLAGCAASATAQVVLSDDPVRAYYGTDTRAYQLLAGASLAVVSRLLPRLALSGALGTAVRQIVLAAGVAVLVVTAARGWGEIAVSTEGFVATGASVAVIWSLDVPGPRWLGWIFAIAPVRYVGEISYGMYLWHWPLMIVLRAATTLSPPEVFAVASVVAAAFAALSHGLVETPIRRSRMLDRFPVATVATGLAASAAVAIWVVAPILRWEAAPRLRQPPPTTTVPGPLPGEPGGTVLLESRDLVGQ